MVRQEVGRILGQALQQALRVIFQPNGTLGDGRWRGGIQGSESGPGLMPVRLTPVSASPARMAWLTGEAPRQRGNREKCRFQTPMGQESSIQRGRI